MREIKNKKKYEFTDSEKEDIITKYKSGLSCTKIAIDYPCSSKTIERFLRKNNIDSKENPVNKFINDLPNEDKEYIINSYKNGVSAVELGKKYNFSESAMLVFLKKNNINYRDTKQCHYKEFSESEQEYIINQYINGISIMQLTKEFNCNEKTINKFIPEDIKIKYKRTKYNTDYRTYKTFSLIEKEEIKDKYLEGLFRKELCIIYNCSIECMDKILKERNVQGKDNPKWDKEKKSFSDDIKKEIVESYKQGIIQEDLASKYNCSRDYIKEILYEYNCSYKDNPNYNFNISKSLESETDNIINLYNNGYSISQISEKYNIGNLVIKNILIDNNVEIRQCGEYTNFTDEELIKFLKEIYNEYGYVNTELLNSLNGYSTSATYNHRFGTFKNAMNKAGLPYITNIVMLDNEICKSAYEYRLSLVLRKYNINYKRDYLYSNLIPKHNKKHSIDYKIDYKDKTLYVEIFGMAGSTYSNSRYDKTKEMKINLCKNNNINLISLYPDDFKLNNIEFEKHIIEILNKEV